MLAIAGLFPGRTTPRSQKHSLSFEWANHLTTTIAGDVLDPSREQGEVEAIARPRRPPGGAEARASGRSSSCQEATRKSCPLDRLVWEVIPCTKPSLYLLYSRLIIMTHPLTSYCRGSTMLRTIPFGSNFPGIISSKGIRLRRLEH